MAVVDIADRRLEPLIAGSMHHYAVHLSRLAADFSAAAAFLLGDPRFEQLGCGGKCFVQAAKQAYSVQGPVSAVLARAQAARLIAETDTVTKNLASVAAADREMLKRQRLAGEEMALTAGRLQTEVEQIVTTAAAEIAAEAARTGQQDPEFLADHLSQLALRAFAHVKSVWDPIYDSLANAALPPAPLAFSGRGIYIETVKLLNQHRLTMTDNSSPEPRGLRMLLGAGRKPANRSTPEPQVDTLTPVVTGISELIVASVGAWQRGALERAQRKGIETSSTISHGELIDRLALFERTVAQLEALRAELARGLSIRHFYLHLLKQAASCSRSA